MVNAISVNISQNRKFLICAWLINRNSNSDVERSKDLVNVKKKKKKKRKFSQSLPSSFEN